jgi:hypothetical protein
MKRQTRRQKIFPLVPWLLAASLAGSACLSCVSTWVEKAGQLLDGSLLAEKDLALYTGNAGLELRKIQTRDDVELLVLNLEAFPFLRIYASAPDQNGVIFLEKLRFLAGNSTGWQEFTLDLSGTGVVTIQDTHVMFRMRKPVEHIQIAAGSIRHEGNSVTGVEALTRLRNRYERILALSAWMHTRIGPAFEREDEFEAYWKPLVLPELVSSKQRPPEWQEPLDKSLWSRGEDIKWNTAYTQAVFPEDLWKLRNSGAMLRDWEEALPWLYFVYQWDSIVDTLAQDRVLLKGTSKK